jgi:SAM-dependent methyltransferase
MTIGEADVRAAWDRNAAAWTDRVRARRDLYRDVFNNPSFFAFLPPLAGLEVVDFGCGEGSNTRELARMGARLTGIDLSPAMIAEARAAEAREPLGITYRVASFTDLADLPPARFDAAVSTMAMMDAPDFAAAAREAFRILKPGGFFAFSVLHPCFVTPSLRWLRDEAGSETGLVVGRYFDEVSFVERWRFSKDPEAERFPEFEVPRFPRTLETYVGGLLAAGFRLTGLKEPRPTEAMAREHPWLRRWREHAAIFLYLAAEKPGRPEAAGVRSGADGLTRGLTDG